ncbi:MAG: tetratricopeptide repeat protein [Phycisphaeraceae bacterium]|nr:tetratricopeptide repeat protein [Phycisphaeraceae bacterium]
MKQTSSREQDSADADQPEFDFNKAALATWLLEEPATEEERRHGVTPDQLQRELEQAARQHQAGNLDIAMAGYQRVLGAQPNNADALHLAGMIDLARGRIQNAIARMESALAAAGPSAFPHYFSNLGNALREAGRYEESEGRYREAISKGGGSADVWNNLGITLLKRERFSDAVVAFAESVQLRPQHAGGLSNLATALAKVGAWPEALRYADAALALAPALRPALSTRAAALRATARLDEAVQAASQIAEQYPAESEAHAELGVALAMAGRHEQAVDAFRRALTHAPDSAPAHQNLGASLLRCNRFEQAEAELRRSTELDPTNAAAFRNLSVALVNLVRLDEAMLAAREAVRIAPDDALNHAGLGAAELIRDRLAEAEHAYRRALELDPTLADAWNGLGVAHEKSGDDAEALRCYTRATELEPDNAHSHVNRAIMLLLRGEMPEGWREYEWRLTWAERNGGGRKGDAPRWKVGEHLPDGTLPRVLIFCEQGLGDAVQFARFLPMVKKAASRVIVQCNAITAPLLRTAPGIDEVVLFDEALPPHDRSLALMSLPAELGTTIGTIPNRVPYFVVSAHKKQEWRSRLRESSGALKVALAWSGSPKNQNDANRSIPLSRLAPLSLVPNTRFYAVLKGSATSQIPEVLPWQVTDLSPFLHDLSDTAGALDEMDLLISVDTSVAHLGGALAKPVWLLAFYPPDFRWLKDRADSPWYPTMRIYRQRARWEWDPIIERVARDLEALVRARKT